MITGQSPLFCLTPLVLASVFLVLKLDFFCFFEGPFLHIFLPSNQETEQDPHLSPDLKSQEIHHYQNPKSRLLAELLKRCAATMNSFQLIEFPQ